MNEQREASNSPSGEPLPIRVGVSACLTGAPVRFDGGHKHDRFVTETLGEYFDLMPVCPEAAIGLGTPREPIRLVSLDGEIRVLGTRRPELDVTEALADYARQVAELMPEISGYIVKRGSPSCGMERVKVYSAGGMPVSAGRGAFTATLMAATPLLPVEEEGRLHDPVLRENFIERVYVYRHWQELVSAGLTPGALVDFHTQHKYQVLAHSPRAYRELGRWVARAGQDDLNRLAEHYIRELMGALSRPASRRRHANALQHLAGYLRKRLDAGDRAELAETIERYACGYVPLVVPMTLMRHFFRRYPHPYAQRQRYLQPYPETLMLRNAV